jgi:hypothetical protein
MKSAATVQNYEGQCAKLLYLRLKSLINIESEELSDCFLSINIYFLPTSYMKVCSYTEYCIHINFPEVFTVSNVFMQYTQADTVQ